MAKGIQDVANMNFTDADGKTQRIDILHDSETYKEIISKMMTSIAEGVAGGKVIGSWSLQKATDSVNGSLPIIEKAIEIYKKIIAATTGENAITVDNIEENCDKIKNVILSVNKMIVNKDMQDTLKNQSDETFKTITSFLDNSNKMISKFGESLKKIAEVMSKVSLDSVEQFKKTIDTYKEAMTALASATVAFNDSSASSITNFNSWGNVQDLDRFANSIKGISSALDSLTYDNLTKLNRETKDLSEFTQSINTLDTSKVNAFTNLSQSMADLSASLGGLDGLTDALANKLSAVLVKLTDELHDTKSTFNTAERLRESREKFVEKAIKRVEDVMKNPMKVKVGLEDENTATSGGSTGSGYSGGSSSYAGGGTPAPQITSPESNMGLASPIAPQETPTEDFTTSPFQNNQPAQSTTKTVDEKKPQSQVNLNNINSTIRETVSSVFEEMIQKYALDGNVAKGNARPSW
jgi:hypothetical protein